MAAAVKVFDSASVRLLPKACRRVGPVALVVVVGFVFSVVINWDLKKAGFELVRPCRFASIQGDGRAEWS